MVFDVTVGWAHAKKIRAQNVTLFAFAPRMARQLLMVFRNYRVSIVLSTMLIRMIFYARHQQRTTKGTMHMLRMFWIIRTPD